MFGCGFFFKWFKLVKRIHVYMLKFIPIVHHHFDVTWLTFFLICNKVLGLPKKTCQNCVVCPKHAHASQYYSMYAHESQYQSNAMLNRQPYVSLFSSKISIVAYHYMYFPTSNNGLYC